MPQRTDIELLTRITNIKSLITSDGKIDATELQSVLTDIVDSKLNNDSYSPGGGGGSTFSLVTLTDAPTIGWAFTGNPAKVSISASRAISITGVGTGVHYSTLEVIHTVAGTTISLPGDTSDVVWKTGVGQTTLLEMYHNGTSYKWKS